MRTREREDRDFYRTPVECAILVDHLVRDAWEPCAGDGRISKNLKGVVLASDIDPQAEGIAQVDFFSITAPPPSVKMIVTNPPFSLWKECIEHAVFTLGLPSLFLLPEEKLAGNTLKRFQDHIHWRGTVSNLIKFDTADGRIVHGNGTMRCAWFLFRPEPSGGKFKAEYLHYEQAKGAEKIARLEKVQRIKK